MILRLKGGISLHSLESHVLTRAIIKAYYILFPEDWKTIYAEKMFTISDLLPMFKLNGRLIFALPFPKYAINTKIKDKTLIKKINKLKYITEDALKQFPAIFESIEQEDSNGLILDSGQVLGTKDDFTINKNSNQQKPECNDELLAVGRQYLISRTRNQMLRQPSEVEQQFFKIEYSHYLAPIYFYLFTENADFTKKITAAIRYLGDRGIGKYTSIGLGGFSIQQIKEVQLTSPTLDCGALTLSSWLPSEEEIKSGIQPLFYAKGEFKPVNHHIFTKPTALKSIRFIESGAILKGVKHQIVGRIENLGKSDSAKERSIFHGKTIIYGGIKLGKI